MTKARVLASESAHVEYETLLFLRNDGLVALGASLLAGHPAGPTLGHIERGHEMGHGSAAARRAQKFPLDTSFSIEMSSA